MTFDSMINKEQTEEPEFDPNVEVDMEGKKKTSLLGKTFKSGRRHQPFPRLNDIRCFQNQVCKIFYIDLLNLLNAVTS